MRSMVGKVLRWVVCGVVGMVLSATASAQTSLTLDEAIALAIERNPFAASQELAHLIAQIAETRATLDRYTARVDVAGGGDAGRASSPILRGYDTTSANWSARASVAVPLTTGGRIDATIDRAKAAAESAEVEVAITARDLARAAYTSYWTIKGFERQIAATEEGLVATRQARKIIESKADVGLSAGVDVNRSTVDLLSQQETLIGQRAAMRSAEIELTRLLHMVGDRLVLTTDPPEPRSGPVVLPADRLANRPEMRRQALSIVQADANVAIARSAALPQVSLNASAGVGAFASGGGVIQVPLFSPTGELIGLQPTQGPPIESELLSQPTVDATIGLALTWNPFDLFRTRQAIKSSKTARDQTRQLNTAERDRLNAEINDAAVRVNALRERYPIVSERLELARDNQAIVADLYGIGSATILDLFNAQSSFRAAAIQEANLTVDLATAELDLAWLLGEDVSGAKP